MPSGDSPDETFRLQLRRSMEGLAGLGTWVDEVVAAFALPRAQEYALRLCVEEAVANVVMHGVAAGSGHGEQVFVRVHRDDGTLHVAVEDDCSPFDPLQQPSPDRSQGLEERPIGGLGIHLMRQYTQSMRYERTGGHNRLLLTIGR